MRKSIFKWLGLIYLLGLTLVIDVFLLAWEKVKRHKIFPGS
ncbi:hypothetical protein QT06_C0001G1020 [archaeon GW2011_AR15]|nr:hypothetical protein QT06_C0001G1020 [archaeon GW2011_AR15]